MLKKRTFEFSQNRTLQSSPYSLNSSYREICNERRQIGRCEVQKNANPLIRNLSSILFSESSPLKTQRLDRPIFYSRYGFCSVAICSVAMIVTSIL